MRGDEKRITPVSSPTIIDSVRDLPVRSRYGNFNAAIFVVASSTQVAEHLALHLGLPPGPQTAPVLVRIQSGCVFGDVLGSSDCDCRWQLEESLRLISEARMGVLLYHPADEGYGFGLLTKARASILAATGITMQEAFRQLTGYSDIRSFSVAGLLLNELGITRVNLLTNNPFKRQALELAGISVDLITPLVIDAKDAGLSHDLRSKRDNLHHWIPGEL